VQAERVEVTRLLPDRIGCPKRRLAAPVCQSLSDYAIIINTIRIDRLRSDTGRVVIFEEQQQTVVIASAAPSAGILGTAITGAEAALRVRQHWCSAN
jgi:hypothetical protein